MSCDSFGMLFEPLGGPSGVKVWATAGASLIIAAACARTADEVDKLVGAEFEFLAGEPGLNRQARSRFRQTESAWRRAVAVDPEAP